MGGARSRLSAFGRRVSDTLDAVPGLSASAIANYTMVGGQVLRTLMMARILGVQHFGILNLANVTANLTAMSDLGTSIVGNQLASQARGRDDLQAALRLQEQAGGTRMLPSLMVGLLVAIGAAILWVGDRRELAIAAGFVALSAPLQGAWFAVREYLRVSGHFATAMRAQIFQVTVWLTVVPAAAWAWGLPGAFATIAASFLAPVLASTRRVPLVALLIPRWKPFRTWLRPGLPIWLGLISSFLYTNIDQFVMGALLGPSAVGIYAIGLLVSTALVAFSDGAAAAAHPRTLESAARDGQLTIFTSSIWKTMRISQAILGLLVPLSWLGLVILTSTVLPDYGQALPIVTLLGPAAAAVGVATASNSTLLATGRHRRVPAIFLLATACKIGLVLLLLTFWPSAVTFAVTAFIGSLVFLVVYLATVASALQVRRPTLWVFFHVLSPASLAAMGALVVLSQNAWGVWGYAGASVLAIVGSLCLHVVMWRAYNGVVAATASLSP